MPPLIIVTPTWQAQSWYPELLRLSVRNQFILPLKEDLLKRPQNQHHPLIHNRTVQLAVSVVSKEGIPNRASDLIVSSRREGTLSTYSSAWNKWVSWCLEKNVDPVRYNVNWILNFLAFMFESRYEYRTICSQQFQLCITILGEDLLESIHRSVL